MKNTGLILIILLIQTVSAFAQNLIVITGKIRDTIGFPISKATISLKFPKNNLTTLSNENGEFIFKANQIGNVELQVTIKGYLPFTHIYVIPNNTHSFTIPPIILYPGYQQLESVTISAIKPILTKEDTIEYRASAFKVRSGDELERLLKVLPGVVTDTGGNITIEGKHISKVLIDGKDYVDKDIQATFRNLPADIIEKIQIIDDYGDKARLTGVKSGEPEKVLNVLLKKERRNGIIGTYEAGQGSANKYIVSAYTTVLKKDQQLLLDSKAMNISSTGNNYQKKGLLGYSDRLTKNLSITGTINYSGDNIHTNGSSITDYIYPSGKQHSEQTSQKSAKNSALTASAGLTYIPSLNSLLKINSYFGTQTNKENSITNSATLNQDSNYKKSISSAETEVNRTKSRYSITEAYFEKKMPESGDRFSSKLTYQNWARPVNDNQQLSNTINIDSVFSSSKQIYLIYTNTTSQQLISELNYYKAVGEKSLLEFGYIFDNFSIKTDQQTDISGTDTSPSMIIDSLSKKNTIVSQINHLKMDFLATSPNLYLSLGMEFQPGSQTEKSVLKENNQSFHYFNVLPHAEISWAFSLKRKLSLELNDATSLPSPQQLQPAVDISNPQYPVQGNPFLKQTNTQTISLHYNYSSFKSVRYYGYQLSLSYKTIKDMIIPNYIEVHDSSPAIQKIQYVNANGFNSININYRLQLPSFVHAHFSTVVEGNMETGNEASMLNNIIYKTNTFTWNQGVNINLVIPTLTEASLVGYYSHIFSRYTGNGQNTSSASLNWVFTDRQTFFGKWILNLSAKQYFINNINGQLKANPVIMDASLRRDLFKKNQVSLILSVKNLLDQKSGVIQTVTPTTVNQKFNDLSARFVLLSFIYKLDKMK